MRSKLSSILGHHLPRAVSLGIQPVLMRHGVRVLLALYLLVLGYLTLLCFPQRASSVNLIPFHTIGFDVRYLGRDLFVNVLGNIIAFLPVGILGPLCFPRRLRSAASVAGAALAVSASIEIAQFFQGHRTSDVDDLILNTLGGWLGWGLFWLGRIWVRRRIGSRTQGASGAKGRIVRVRVLP